VRDVTRIGCDRECRVPDRQLWGFGQFAQEGCDDHAWLAASGSEVFEFGAEGKPILTGLRTLAGLVDRIDFP
jgi:hypothetical protein